MYKIAHIYRFASRVLAVAVEDGVYWTAYIDAVPGQNHEKEANEVKEHGNKLDERVAKFLFPDLAKKYKWRE